MTPVGALRRRDLVRAARVAAWLVGVAVVSALIVRVGLAGRSRAFLGFGFGGVPNRLDESLAILANNLRILGGVLLATIIVQLGRLAVPPAPWTDVARLPGLLCDIVLAVVAGAHAVLVGAGIGAYGSRMLLALLPHGPLELAAYSLALALYLAARREPIAPARGVAVAVAAAITLSLAALLETFVSP